MSPLAATTAAYRAAHVDFPGRIAAEARQFIERGVDAVFSNVAYLPLAGARAAGLPAMAMCSLNWADLFAHFYGNDDWARPILAQIRAAYNAAPFLRTSPGMAMPALEMDMPGSRPVAFNDVSFVRVPHGRVAELSYSVGDQEVGHVRCDGLVAATPAGSTGYNLANAGPILAWGVEGYVVSFIAPHTLTARPLVVAPGDSLCVQNAAGRDPVEIELDGEHIGDLGPGEQVEVRFRDGAGSLAQLPGASFYTRIREKFGRLAK